MIVIIESLKQIGNMILASIIETIKIPFNGGNEPKKRPTNQPINEAFQKVLKTVLLLPFHKIRSSLKHLIKSIFIFPVLIGIVG